MPDLEENERSENGKAREDKTYDLKLDRSNIPKGRLLLLQRLFLEVKWFNNHIVATNTTALEQMKTTRRLKALHHRFPRTAIIPWREKLSVKIRQEFEREHNVKRDAVNKVA
ncbi:MAG: hypothetical protein RAK25_06935, partial [TACK group archaeon]|nr:hypothetical protein [TACK group archaeon]